MQIYGDIVCYRTLICDSGLLCLDWRDICDGLQQCMYGYDEDNCDLLEFNECEDDEYRCANGMCIPDDFFLDGEYDCSDLSDENQWFNDANCTLQNATYVCDDRICLRNQWSCGDGQCISSRLLFQKESSGVRQSCESRRDQFYLCETAAWNASRQWTLPNGKCGPMRLDQAVFDQNRTDSEQCLSFIQRASTQEMYGDNTLYRNLSSNSCSCDIIQYPHGRILAPYAMVSYNEKRNWTRRIPDYLLLNGTIKCRGYMINVSTWIPYQSEVHLGSLENLLCTPKPAGTVLSEVGYDQFCYNGSRTFNNHFYNFYDICQNSKECVSAYRIRDASKDCHDGLDEEPTSFASTTCLNVQRHRFRCSNTHPSCLPVSALYNLFDRCRFYTRDFSVEIYNKLSKSSCTLESKEECAFIRNYLESAAKNGTGNSSYAQGVGSISFRSYCDTFWDENSNEDEDLNMCRNWWKCLETQWRCRTGQCIELDWALDGEWDCADASDEEAFFVDNNTHSMHNVKLRSGSLLLDRYMDRYMRFSSGNPCNLSIEFSCKRINASNITFGRPCIRLEQIGDGIIDCVGAWDEHARLKHCSLPSVLGYYFRYPLNDIYEHLSPHCIRICNSSSDYCYRFRPDSFCEGSPQYMCLNGTCIEPGRKCDGNIDCAYGEDEYLCNAIYGIEPIQNTEIYRKNKEQDTRKEKQELLLPQFPSGARKTLSRDTLSQILPDSPIKSDISVIPSSEIAYYCNRGVGASHNESIVCFCPAQYYGDKCQYHSDRLTVLFHVNLTQSNYSLCNNYKLVVQFLVIFLYENQPLMTESFHVRPAAKGATYQKNIRQLLYSRTTARLQGKRSRNKNRSILIMEHPYSVRIEAYEVQPNTTPQFVVLWLYPIYFDFLPSFRFAKILRFAKLNGIEDPCRSNPCHVPKKCHPILNQQSNYTCLCPDNYTGSDCSVEDEKCHRGFCSENALCKSNYHGFLLGNGTPYCLCPLERSGPRCEITHGKCQSHPCQNHGTCFAAPDLHDFFCQCDDYHHGEICELVNGAVNIFINESLKYRAAIIQYFHINFITLDLIMAHQRLYDRLPHDLDYLHDRITVPEVVVAKLYSDTAMKMYLISLQIDTTAINISTDMNDESHCPDAHTLFNSANSML